MAYRQFDDKRIRAVAAQIAHHTAYSAEQVAVSIYNLLEHSRHAALHDDLGIYGGLGMFMHLPHSVQQTLEALLAQVDDVPQTGYTAEETAQEQERYEQRQLAERDREIERAFDDAQARIGEGMLPSEAYALMQQELSALPRITVRRFADLDLRDDEEVN